MFSISEEDDLCILEMGANKCGAIAELCRIECGAQAASLQAQGTKSLISSLGQAARLGTEFYGGANIGRVGQN